MYYELYADSLWLLNFVMNLYILLLVDRSLMRTATRMRLILGAAVGAGIYLLPFLLDGPMWVKYPLGTILGIFGMVLVAFRPTGPRAVAKLLERLVLYSFLLGGGFLFVTECVPILRDGAVGLCSVLGLGALGFLAVTYLQGVSKNRRERNYCRATLGRNGNNAQVTALLDSGNSLVEPISGQPVSIICERIYRQLWQEEDVPYRAVPYQSIGKRRGILLGYRLPRLDVEMDGVVKRFQNVYVAVSKEYAGDVEMILNPMLFESFPEKKKKKPEKRK